MNTIVTKTEVKLNTKPERNRNAKPVYCITTGKVYASSYDAAKGENTSQCCVSGVCTGRYKTTGGKRFCHVSDMPVYVLEICNTMQGLTKDANAYRAIKAEEERKAAREKKKVELQNKIAAREEQLKKEAEELGTLKAMFTALEAEFNT